jgi:FkbM family methyltransferase
VSSGYKSQLLTSGPIATNNANYKILLIERLYEKSEDNKLKRTTRNILMKFFRNRIITKEISVPNGLSISWRVSPDSQLKYLKSEFDQELADFVSSFVKTNDKIWDIGANCGTFSAFCISKGVTQKIIAIEPDMFLASLLLQNASRYNLYPVCAAVADNHNFLELHIAENGRASNSISSTKGRTERGGVRYEQPVVTTTLDDMQAHFGTPDIVKIDIEGAELLAISGATELIAKRETNFLIEIDPENKDDVIQKFHRHNYEFKEIFYQNYYFSPKC